MKQFCTACACSFIGSVVGLELGTLWWIGLIVGFVIGYLAYDFGTILEAIPAACAEARMVAGLLRPSREQLRRSFYAFGAGISGSMTVFLFIVIFCPSLPADQRAHHCSIAGYMTLANGIFTMLVAQSQDSIEECEKFIKLFHPIPFFFLTLPRFTTKIVRTLPRAMAAIARFVRTFATGMCRFIHSNARLLFGIDVAIGVAIGHYTSSALLGGFAGGCWWLLDWHLISIKVMGVKPS